MEPTKFSAQHSLACPPCISYKCPILINSSLTSHPASCWILSAPKQKNLCSTEPWNVLYGFRTTARDMYSKDCTPARRWASASSTGTGPMEGPWLWGTVVMFMYCEIWVAFWSFYKYTHTLLYIGNKLLALSGRSKGFHHTLLSTFLLVWKFFRLKAQRQSTLKK